MILRRGLPILAGLGLIAIMWKELPAMRRYIKIERM